MPSLKMTPGRAAAAVMMTAATALVVTAQPASASSHRPCGVVKHSNLAGVTKQGAATATVGTDGVKLTTGSDNNDKVTWKTTFSPVLASTVDEVNYETVKLDQAGAGVNDAALPAYHLYVRTPAGEGTLVFEPYYYTMKQGINGGNPPRGLRTEWDVLAGPLWTPSTTITGLPKTAGGDSQTNLTFAEVVKANPKMTVTGIGFGLGTYNTNVIAVVDDQRFATKRDCSEHQWSTGFTTGSWWPGWLWRRR